MNQLEKYNQIFQEVFNLTPEKITNNLTKDSFALWDSVHQLLLVNKCEEVFDIFLEPEEIIQFTSYDNGLSILRKYQVDI